MPSVADLVEPLVANGDAVPTDIRDAADGFVAAGAVALDRFSPLEVTATVATADGPRVVRLASTDEGLSASCDCPVGSSGLLCPHSLATAIEAWQRAPKRSAS